MREAIERGRSENPPDLALSYLERLRRERLEFYARHRGDPCKLSWEIAGLGWTRTVYGRDTMLRALSELEPELAESVA